MDAILGFAEHLVKESPTPPVAIGIGVPGLVDRERGVAVASSNLRWRNVPFVSLLRDRLGIPAILNHDVRCGSIAEYLIGAARGCPTFLFVTLGTGVGASIWTEGRAYTGGHSAAGELGHVTVIPGGELCGCGRRGCLETVASASAVARRYQRLAGGEPVTAQAVAEAVQRGDPLARLVWDEAVWALALALANACALLDPSRIIIGGGLADAGATLFDPLRTQFESYHYYGNRPELVPAQLGPDAGVMGAGFAAWAHARGMT